VVEDGEVWSCPDRGHYNGVVRSKCWVCGAERGDAELRPRPPGSSVSHTGTVRERSDDTDKPVPYRTVLGPLRVSYCIWVHGTKPIRGRQVSANTYCMGP